MEAEAQVANAKPQSRGVLMGKAFLEGLSSLPSLTAVCQKPQHRIRHEVPKGYISACFDGFKQALGDRWEAGIVEGVEGSLLRRISLRKSLWGLR